MRPPQRRMSMESPYEGGVDEVSVEDQGTAPADQRADAGKSALVRFETLWCAR